MFEKVVGFLVMAITFCWWWALPVQYILFDERSLKIIEESFTYISVQYLTRLNESRKKILRLMKPST